MATPRPSVDAVDEKPTISVKERLIPSRKKKAYFKPESFILPSKGDSDSILNVHVDEYFRGPRELDRHSKWPMFLRIHGSCLPELVLPLLFVGAWSTTVCLFSRHVYSLGIPSTLLTVLGLVIGLALSFRSSTAYERYMEGRKSWTTLMLVSHNLARNIWINAEEREDHEKDDLLAKVTALNLIVAFARSLKHRLRFQPYTHYSDLGDLVQHIDTFAKEATELEGKQDDPGPISFWESWGTSLGVSFAISNPRKLVKSARYPLGNLPLEILNYLTAYCHEIIDNGTLKAPIYQMHALNAVMNLDEVLVSTDRILNTPLPLAYAIAISQITWVYILILPFQLYDTLGLVAIPGTLFAAYIIFGFAFIGNEIENPFGEDVNDLPLDTFCNQLAADIDIISSSAPPKSDTFIKSKRNCIMDPLNQDSYEEWKDRDIKEIREALRKKAVFSMKKSKPRSDRNTSQDDGRYERAKVSDIEMAW